MASRRFAFLLSAAMLPGAYAPSYAQDAMGDKPTSLAHPATPAGNPGIWLTKKDFPTSARARGESGITRFHLQIDETGKPIACDIVMSSGFVDLDDAACSAMRKHATFHPARDDAGNPVKGSFTNNARWIR